MPRTEPVGVSHPVRSPARLWSATSCALPVVAVVREWLMNCCWLWLHHPVTPWLSTSVALALFCAGLWFAAPRVRIYAWVTQEGDGPEIVHVQLSNFGARLQQALSSVRSTPTLHTPLIPATIFMNVKHRYLKGPDLDRLPGRSGRPRWQAISTKGVVCRNDRGASAVQVTLGHRRKPRKAFIKADPPKEWEITARY